MGMENKKVYKILTYLKIDILIDRNNKKRIKTEQNYKI